MNANNVYKKIVEFARETISLEEAQIMILSSDRDNPVRVGWTTEKGKNRYYNMYWDTAAYVGGDAGGSSTNEAEDMVNIQVLDKVGDWRTLDYSSVSKVRFNGQTFKVK